jgi:anti-anti-sigma factor
MEKGYRYMILNLSEVQRMDSTGVGILIQVSHWTGQRKGRMLLSNPGPLVEKVLKMTKLDEYFTVCDSSMEARLKLDEWKRGRE